LDLIVVREDQDVAQPVVETAAAGGASLTPDRPFRQLNERDERDAQAVAQDGFDNRRRQIAVFEGVGCDVGVQDDEAQRLPKVGATSGVSAAEELVQLLVGVEHVTYKIIHRPDRLHTLAACQLVK
jgi:hypothetical protein